METWEKRRWGQKWYLKVGTHDYELPHKLIIAIIADHTKAALAGTSAVRAGMWAARAGLMAGLLIEILNSKYLLPADWADRAAKHAKVHWDTDKQRYVYDEDHDAIATGSAEEAQG